MGFVLCWCVGGDAGVLVVWCWCCLVGVSWCGGGVGVVVGDVELFFFCGGVGCVVGVVFCFWCGVCCLFLCWCVCWCVCFLVFGLVGLLVCLCVGLLVCWCRALHPQA